MKRLYEQERLYELLKIVDRIARVRNVSQSNGATSQTRFSSIADGNYARGKKISIESFRRKIEISLTFNQIKNNIMSFNSTRGHEGSLFAFEKLPLQVLAFD